MIVWVPCFECRSLTGRAGAAVVGGGVSGCATCAPIVALDLGCNEGDLTVNLALALGRVTGAPVRMLGLDLDEELIARAKVSSDASQSNARRVS